MKINSYQLLLFAALLAAPVAAVAQQATFRPIADTVAPAAFVQAQNAFGLDLLRQATQGQARNVFLSPLSLTTALLMAHDGAAGPTRTALARTLRMQALPDSILTAGARANRRKITPPGLSIPSDTVSENMKQYLADTRASLAGAPQLLMANAVWADPQATDFQLRAAYANRLRRVYHASARQVAFPRPAADSINAWANRQTFGRIPQLVDAKSLSGPLVLTNAVYFKGRWETEFPTRQTKQATFKLPHGKQRVPLMHLRQRDLAYAQGPGWRAVRLPYAQSSLSMTILVPDKPNGLPTLLAALTPENWLAWQQLFRGQGNHLEVDLKLPRFRTEGGGDVTDLLKPLGLTLATSPQADFSPSGFSGVDKGHIGAVIHKTYLDVNEQATEAAAATAIMVIFGFGGGKPAPYRRVSIHADHPFLCAITDERTGAILFCGAIFDPTK